ncbi:FKBP-type peptidyl-prolyl cis-trans isomerase [Caulobacter henricii]|uniref:Peptidyl-prolyl cis-trans isomerase n=1 Tax=Caulobacter henricii TaxID=69395 RepID=A0A0P0P3C4_9CAUL|nr:FKBP-type peptidyl-prolyl cis-trans isomerase [Caulobacter henricii]ALL14973.1 peptidylprolyl isomerase [Caulobacter henricii]
MHRRALLTLLTAGAAVSLAGCGNKKAAENLVAADAFMAKNAKEPGVVTLPEGLQYKIIRSGPNGGMHPTRADEVKVNYEGKLIDGTIFDSSYERGVPASFPLDGLVPAWVIALQRMKAGDEWMLYVPPALGYGAQDKGPIPGNSVMIFRIELIDVLRAPTGTAKG